MRVVTGLVGIFPNSHVFSTALPVNECYFCPPKPLLLTVPGVTSLTQRQRSDTSDLFQRDLSTQLETLWLADLLL